MKLSVPASGDAGPSTAVFVVAGVGCLVTEDWSSQGAVHLFSAVRERSQTAEGAEVEQWQLKAVYRRELAGPVTALSASDGRLVVAYGHNVRPAATAFPRIPHTALHAAEFVAPLHEPACMAHGQVSGVRTGVGYFHEAMIRSMPVRPQTSGGPRICTRRRCRPSAWGPYYPGRGHAAPPLTVTLPQRQQSPG